MHRYPGEGYAQYFTVPERLSTWMPADLRFEEGTEKVMTPRTDYRPQGPVARDGATKAAGRTPCARLPRRDAVLGWVGGETLKRNLKAVRGAAVRHTACPWTKSRNPLGISRPTSSVISRTKNSFRHSLLRCSTLGNSRRALENILLLVKTTLKDVEAEHTRDRPVPKIDRTAAEKWLERHASSGAIPLSSTIWLAKINPLKDMPGLLV